jgi:hypothetical protein
MDKNHLVILCHGLWGNAKHLAVFERAIAKELGVQTLLVTANEYNLTYDGLAVCASRLIQQLSAYLKECVAPVTRISFLGYSLGGLINRHAIGLLYAQGFFKSIKPRTFVTFATPHLGGRSYHTGFWKAFYDSIGSRTLSLTGKQLFLEDKVDGKPLLQIMAEENSIFYKALQQFENIALYGNLVGERTVLFPTATINLTNPYLHINKLALRYIEEDKYGPLIVDLNDAEPSKSRESVQTSYQKPPINWRRYFFMSLFPLVFVIFLIMAIINNLKSQWRIKSHKKDSEDTMPLLSEQIEDVMEQIGSAEGDGGSLEGIPNIDPPIPLMSAKLNKLPWQKYGVHIHKTDHAHAAIVSRGPEECYSEGRLAIQHFIDNVIAL